MYLKKFNQKNWILKLIRKIIYEKKEIITMNTNNYVMNTGRLTDDIKIFDNADGSKKIRFTLAVTNNYKDKNGNRGSQFIPLEAFIGADKDLGVYSKMNKGDLVTVQSTIKNNNYTDKNGQNVYGIVLQVEQVTLLESKQITENRKAARAAATA